MRNPHYLPEVAVKVRHGPSLAQTLYPGPEPCPYLARGGGQGEAWPFAGLKLSPPHQSRLCAGGGHLCRHCRSRMPHLQQCDGLGGSDRLARSLDQPLQPPNLQFDREGERACTKPFREPYALTPDVRA